MRRFPWPSALCPVQVPFIFPSSATQLSPIHGCGKIKCKNNKVAPYAFGSKRVAVIFILWPFSQWKYRSLSHAFHRTAVLCLHKFYAFGRGEGVGGKCRAKDKRQVREWEIVGRLLKSKAGAICFSFILMFFHPIVIVVPGNGSGKLHCNF